MESGTANWQQAMKARLGTLPLLKFLTTTGGIAVFFYAYFWVMRHPLSAVTVMPVTWLDDLVGFHPQSFMLYASLWAYIALGTALPRDLWGAIGVRAGLPGDGRRRLGHLHTSAHEGS